MRLAFSTLAAPEMPLAELAAIAAEAGYDGLELRGKDRQHLDPAMSPQERAEVRRVMEETGLEAAAVTSYVRLAEHLDDAGAGAEALRAGLVLARDVGAGMLRVFGGPLPDGVDRATAVASMGALLLDVAGDAEAAGVRIALETHDAWSLGTAVAEVLARAAHPSIVALWDVHHPWRHGETLAETLDALWPRIGYVHVKDAFPMPDGKPQLCLMGAGTVPVREALGMLAARGWDGWVVVEWEKAWHPELPDARVAAPQHVLKLRAYLESST